MADKKHHCLIIGPRKKNCFAEKFHDYQTVFVLQIHDFPLNSINLPGKKFLRCKSDRGQKK